MPPAQELTTRARPCRRSRCRASPCATGGASRCSRSPRCRCSVPFAPTYDPWAWIIWGREILHLDLSTVDGPSWKPLPVLLTTPFALFGGARARPVALRRPRRRARRRRRWPSGSRAGSAALPAGRRGRRAYALAPWTLRNAALGNSEGLLVALVLAAVDRHLAGRRGRAFVLAVGAGAAAPRGLAVPRPLRALAAVARARGCAARRRGLRRRCPLLWLLPELWGSGDPLRAAHRAQQPARQQRGLRRRPGPRGARPVRAMLTPALWIGARGRARRRCWRVRWLGSPRAPSRVVGARAGRRGVGRRGRAS